MRQGVGRLDVADHHHEQVVGNVAVAVVGADVVRLEFVENLRVTDDGETAWITCVGRFKEALAGAPAGIVAAHVHFAADDLQLLVQLGFGEAGVLHDVAQNINGDPGSGVGNVDVIDGAVEGSVGVHVAAGVLDFLVNAAAGAAGGAFEKHVFENVGKAGAEPMALHHAPGVAPGLGGDDRRAVVLANNDDQPVVQGVQADAGGSGRNRAGAIPVFAARGLPVGVNCGGGL